MNLKEKYLEGNNFILSPRGKISRIRYFVYALILEILYRLFLSSGIGKEVSPILFVIGFLAIPIIILKLFNYKKRAYSFLNNNILAYLYSLFYMFIGAFMQEYLYLLELSNKKSLYELTQSPTFQEYANINVPYFIGSAGGTVIFYTLCGFGFIMFLCLIFYPNKQGSNINEFQNINIKNKLKFFTKKITCSMLIITIITYLITCVISYNIINKKAYYGLNYILNEQQIEKVNNLIRLQYQTALDGYKDMARIHGSWPKEEIPQEPLYFGEYEAVDKNSQNFNYNTISMNNIADRLYYFSEISEDYGENYSILKNHWGKMYFNKDNHYFADENNNRFYPRKMLLFCIISLLPICILCSFLLILSLLSIIKLLNSIKTNLNLRIKISAKKLNLSAKLQELNAIKEQGLITEEDYNNKKSQLLDEF